MKFAVLGLLSVACTVVAVPVMQALVRALRLVRPNFKGVEIPTGFGYLLVLSGIPAYAAWIVLMPAQGVRTGAFLAAAMVFGTVGLLDDMCGSRAVGGFRGHFALLARGKVSTGAIKAAVGGIASLALGGIAAGFEPFPTVVNGLLVALTANTLNLLDLRPGRAVSCFWVGLLALAGSHAGRLSTWPQLVALLPAAAWLTGLDRSATVMLGDAGSNVLGAALGLALAWELGVPAKLVLIASLAAVHIYAEKYSISRLIESSRALRSIDCMLGER